MTTATLTYLKLQKRIQTKVDSVSLPNVNWKIVFLTGFLAMAVSSVFYALQINDLTKGSYLVNSYQNKINELSDTNKDLQVNFAESSFLGQALAKAESLNFQKTTSIKYIKILDNSVAVVK